MNRELFSTFTLGRVELSNRMVMAPMTRCRATPEHVPTPLMAEYYGQRASAGLIVTEGTSPAPEGLGYARIPGLFNAEHVAAWRVVTDAVHAQGGRIFVQFMHTGRVSHPLNMPVGARVLAPSAVQLGGTMWTDAKGMQPHPAPEAMTEDDIAAVIRSFAAGAALAVEAGFDGVELHAANGYLLEQFLGVTTNKRTDRWGGSVENRLRFVLEVARATAGRIGADRVGMRISPYGVFNEMQPDADTDALYERLASELSALGLVYLHVLDHSAQGAPPVPAALKARLRAVFSGAMILAGGYDASSAEADLAAGRADLIAFGRPFVANPDLVTRLRENAPLAAVAAGSLYTPGAKGYTDYPALA
ncbi:MAG TPA: alkene reductase [Kiritimatiellia bacterium]|nr:alkene reductase [Kiritimatiellia bacterium]